MNITIPMPNMIASYIEQTPLFGPVLPTPKTPLAGSYGNRALPGPKRVQRNQDQGQENHDHCKHVDALQSAVASVHRQRCMALTCINGRKLGIRPINDPD